MSEIALGLRAGERLAVVGYLENEHERLPGLRRRRRLLPSDATLRRGSRLRGGEAFRGAAHVHSRDTCAPHLVFGELVGHMTNGYMAPHLVFDELVGQGVRRSRSHAGGALVRRRCTGRR